MSRSQSALDWIEEVVRGPAATVVDPQTALIEETQADLARRYRLSAGTVNYRLDKLGSVVRQRRGGLVVDLAALAELRQQTSDDRLKPSRALCAALAEAWGRPGPAPGEVQLLVGGWRAPSCTDVARLLEVSRGTAQKHLTRLELEGLLVRVGRTTYLTALAGAADAVSTSSAPPAARQRTDVAGEQGIRSRVAGGTPADLTALALEVLAQGFQTMHVLADALGALVSGLPDSTIPRTDVAQITRKAVAQFAELRDEVSRISVSEETDKSENITTSNESTDLSGLEAANREPAAARRQFADSPTSAPAPSADPPMIGICRGGPPIGSKRVLDLAAPLQAVCRELDLPDDLDENGCAALGMLSETQLTFRVQRMIRDVRANPKRFRRPLGLLVRDVRAGKVDRFPLPPPPAEERPVVPAPLTQRDIAEAQVAELERDTSRQGELEALDQAVCAARTNHPLAMRRLPGLPRPAPSAGVDHNERVAYVEGLLCRGEKLAPDRPRHRRPTAVP